MGNAVYRLLGDHPYDRENDPLGFDMAAAELRDLILASAESTPMTLGIEAPWGMGKSTLMGKVSRALSERPEVEILPFNAWTSSRDDALEGLIKSVLLRMDTNVLRRALRSERISSALRIGVSLLAGWFGVGKIVDRIWERISEDPGVRNEVSTLMSEIMREWQAEVPEPNRLLCVFIDDLDRCAPETVFRIFEAIKLYLSAPGFLFVIGFDTRMVSKAILTEKKYSESVTARHYIEKIIQVTHRIAPPTEDQLSRLLEEALVESGVADLLEENERRLILEQNNGNPRRVKRFINRFVLEERLGRASVPPRALIRALILQMYFPSFTSLLAESAAEGLVQEFEGYVTARFDIKAGEFATPAVKAAFEHYRIAMPENPSPSEYLTVLDGEVPEDFPRLAANDAFVSFVRDLRQDEGSDEAFRIVREKEEEQQKFVQQAQVEMQTEGPAFLGRVLWIDDHPENNTKIADQLRKDGFDVIEAKSMEEALPWVSSGVEALISDVGRDDKSSSGFEDVSRLRDEGFDRPVLFYTTRMSSTARKQAKDLFADVATSPGQVRKWVRGTLGGGPAEKGGPDEAPAMS